MKINAGHLRKLNQQEHVMKVVRTFLSPDGYLMKAPFASWLHWQLDKVLGGLQKLPARGKYLLKKNENRYEVKTQNKV